MITTTGNTTTGPQQSTKHRQHLQQQFNMHVSSQSLTEMSDSNCPLTHQYHYIQYPAYYQLMQDRLTTSTTCRCPCSCNSNRAQPQQEQKASSAPFGNSPPRHKHQHSDDSQMAVAVIVHRQAGSGSGSGGNGDGTNSNQQVVKAKSEQSLITHSYQALNHIDNRDANYASEEKQLNVEIVNANTSCGCELECTCEITALPAKNKSCAKVGLSELMLGADEITVSESDNNSIIVKRKGREQETEHDVEKSNTWCVHKPNYRSSTVRGRIQKLSEADYNSSQIDIYSDEEDDGINSCVKMQSSGVLEDDQRPPLPPRPPPRPRNVVVNMSARNGTGIKKYVVWCLICGGFSCLLGVLFLGVYFLLHSYTITVGNFETVPTFVPATLLILTGLCIMSLARRRNRYSYLIKLSGACGLISALTCALVTVTTTVLHMSRLQALRECEYAQKTRTCTCYSDMIESQVERVDKGVRLVFDSLSDCGVVHGSLYSCLRAIFGLSVAGVLIAVFSCMLVYQLLSHERKKMYWEQLELRCRSLYTSQQGPPPPNMAAMAAAAGRANACRCCEQCHAHRQMTLPQAAPAAYPWDDGADGPRFWTGQPPGNFYSPNPGGDDLHNNAGANSVPCRSHNLNHTRSRVSGWSWPRMPWQRSSPVTSNRFRQTPSSPDSQYGFSNTAAVPPIIEATLANGAGDDITMLSQPTNHAQTFNVVATGNLPYGVWGPPPPYSDPNSPARRGYYQYMMAPNPVCLNGASDRQSTTSGVAEQPHAMECRSHHRSAYIDGNQAADGTAYYAAQSSSMRSLAGKRQAANSFKSKGGDYENTFSDSDGCGGGTRDHISNTLPTRKVKKRVEAGVKSIGPNSQSTQRVNVQNVFMNNVNVDNMSMSNNEHGYHELLETTNNTNMSVQNSGSINMTRGQSAQRQTTAGVENSAFQNSAECTPTAHTDNQESCDPTESEVYFADVSSCCNISVKNDNYYDEANQQANKRCHNHHSTSAHSPVNNNSDEDYLAQRFGKRENSIRSRLPFPQVACTDDYDKALNNTMQKEISRHSMCSIESEAKTEFTDLSPSTPCGNKFVPSQFAAQQCDDSINDESALAPPPPKFVASFPYLSESPSLEAHCRSTRNVNEILHASTETQYEIINEPTVQPTALLSTPCKPVSFPISPKGKRSLKCKNSGSSKTQNVKKSNAKENRFEKSTPPYQSDLEWSDSSNCTNDRQRL